MAGNSGLFDFLRMVLESEAFKRESCMNAFKADVFHM